MTGYATTTWVATNLTYCAPLYNPSFTGVPKIGTKVIATTDQIPNLNPYAKTSDIISTLAGYATLDSPTFLGYATVNGYGILTQTSQCAPAFFNVGRYIELDVQIADEARLDFHSLDSSDGMDYDARIVCNSGITNDVGGGTLSFYASQFIFHNNILISNGTTNTAVATIDLLSFYAPLSNAHFTDSLSIPGAVSTDIIEFATGLPLGSDLSAARIILHPSSNTGNEWYGFGMNSSTLNYNVGSGRYHKFYCGSTVYLSLTNTASTFSNNVTCGSNSLTCGSLICTSGTLGGQTIATVNQIPSLSGYAPLASPALTGSPTVGGNPILGRTTTLDPAYYGAGRRIELDVSVANTARLDFHSYDTKTTVDYDRRCCEHSWWWCSCLHSNFAHIYWHC